MPSEAVGFSPSKHQSIQCRLKPRHSHCCPQPFVIPAKAGI
ncbi:hypothetical protein [Neisseria blantyrii]|nr:hypothetical protein [Neisseria blantyrii]